MLIKKCNPAEALKDTRSSTVLSENPRDMKKRERGRKSKRERENNRSGSGSLPMGGSKYAP